MTEYTATVTRDGKWWMIEIPELDALTQARRLGEVEAMARSLIAITQGVAADSFYLRIVIGKIGDVDVESVRAELKAHRQQLAELQQRVRRESVELARALSNEGVPVRDIGTALDVSHQRAQQLIDA